MKTAKHILVVVIVLMGLLMATSAAQSESSAAPASHGGNVMCPVMPDREASDDFTASYRGMTVRFCCSECVKEFQSSPEDYIAALPAVPEPSVARKVRAYLLAYSRLWVIAGLALLLLLLRTWRWLRPPSSADLRTRLGRVMGQPVSAVVPMVLVNVFFISQIGLLIQKQHDDHMAEDIHFATFYDFGYPPVPKRPEKPAALQATFYRGNDERNSKLFNNGNYRTATFDLSLQDADGTILQTGDAIEGRELFVVFDIDRPAFTPDFLYSDELMGKMFLTEECDIFLGRRNTIHDLVPLSTTETMQHWQARFPIAIESCCGDSELNGVIYVCERRFAKPWWTLGGEVRYGSRFHYGIAYDLSITEGRLTEESDLWMGALYRTRKFTQNTIPLDQWFSHHPIPELPAAGTDDPVLLGIDDYVSVD